MTEVAAASAPASRTTTSSRSPPICVLSCANLLRVFEHTLAAVDGIGLDIDGMLDAWMTVNALCRAMS